MNPDCWGALGMSDYIRVRALRISLDGSKQLIPEKGLVVDQRSFLRGIGVRAMLFEGKCKFHCGPLFKQVYI